MLADYYMRLARIDHANHPVYILIWYTPVALVIAWASMIPVGSFHSWVEAGGGLSLNWA